MCVLAAWMGMDSKRPLVVGANRDVRHTQRPPPRSSGRRPLRDCESGAAFKISPNIQQAGRADNTPAALFSCQASSSTGREGVNG